MGSGATTMYGGSVELGGRAQCVCAGYQAYHLALSVPFVVSVPRCQQTLVLMLGMGLQHQHLRAQRH